MPESDVTKMKVADLKRELKLRGLPLNGNKNELQDRLQTALLEGDISLEDSAIADAIDDDVSLTDEDEHKLLSENEELLLKSPIRTLGSTPPDVETPASLSDLTPSTIIPPLTTKKIVLKRNNSLSLSTTQLTTTTTTSKENAAPDAAAIKDALDSEANTLKSKHKPIVVGSAAVESKDAAEKKLGELSIKERLELRAKKFGIAVEEKAATPTAKTVGSSPAVNKSSSASIKANKGNKETDEQQKEALKRRAERFGCVVPEKTTKAEVEERLQKRKARFGASAETATDAKSPDAWAEKARARLERFKAAPTASAAETAAK